MTPQTLRQAIQEGIQQAVYASAEAARTNAPAPKMSTIIEEHVLAFLRTRLLALTHFVETGPITNITVMTKLREFAQQVGIERRL